MEIPGTQRIKNYGIEFKLKAVQLRNQPGLPVMDVPESQKTRAGDSLGVAAPAWLSRFCSLCVPSSRGVCFSDVHAGELMIARKLLFAGVVAAALPSAGLAESLRCQNGIAAEGDSRLAVVYKCGQPALRDNYCAPVYYGGSIYPVPEPTASQYVPCIYTEEWLYERGPGELLVAVRIRGGRVQSISYGRQPQ